MTVYEPSEKPPARPEKPPAYPVGDPELIATVGPASEHLVRELWEAGATCLRINASHLAAGGLAPLLDRLRAQAPAAPVVVDLQGAKMRLGRFEPRPVAAGERLTLALSPEPGELPVPHPELFAAVREGETLTGDDGRLQLRVESTAPGRLQARVLADAQLRPRKGVNVLEHPVELTGLTASDAAFVDEALEATARHGGAPALSFAWSFMSDGREAAWLRARAPGRPVAGKVERQEAVDGLVGLASRVDAVWICRGDLGEQLGLPGLARFVAEVDPPRLGVPVIMAGQVLEHLTAHPEPTRSEVCHLFDLLSRGYAGIVLSDETAVGRDPVNAVRTAARLLRELRTG